MVILAAFSVLYTYTCSASSSMPEVQLWRSNTFSPAFKCSFKPQRRWVNIVVGCWHSTIRYTTTTTDHLQPRKQIRMKSGSIAINNMPTARDVNVLSIVEKEGFINPILNVDEADKFVAKLQARNFPIFSPPGANSTRTCARNNTVATKTKLKAEKKAAKEKKAQADEEKKLAVATCKLKAQAKKREKAIALAEARAQKALAKVDALQTQLAAAKDADETMRTPTRARGAHVPKKSKGVGGGVALLTPINLTTIASPQRKGLSPKKRVMVHSPHQSMTNEVASLSGSSTCGSDSDEHMALSSELESSSSLCSASSG
jgi:hypothetical protein